MLIAVIVKAAINNSNSHCNNDGGGVAVENLIVGVLTLLSLVSIVAFFTEPVFRAIVIVVVLLIISLAIRGRIKKVKEKKTYKIRQQEESKRRAIEEQKEKQKIVSSHEFQDSLQKLKEEIYWMTLADAGHNVTLKPLPSLEDEQTITLTYNGYDLFIGNLKTYYNGSTWQERKRGLVLFAKDLFGSNYETVKDLVNMEYIADDMIKLDKPDRWESDYKIVRKVIVYMPQTNSGIDCYSLYMRCLGYW